jgi:hypothetical protein
MCLELIGGNAFSIKHYKPYIESVEAALRTATDAYTDLARTDLAASAAGMDGSRLSSLVESIRLPSATYLRIMIIENDICFLSAFEDTSPIMRGDRIVLASKEDREIHCYIDHGELVCVDGWLRVDVRESDYKLVSLPAKS